MIMSCSALGFLPSLLSVCVSLAMLWCVCAWVCVCVCMCRSPSLSLSLFLFPSPVPAMLRDQPAAWEPGIIDGDVLGEAEMCKDGQGDARMRRDVQGCDVWEAWKAWMPAPTRECLARLGCLVFDAVAKADGSWGASARPARALLCLALLASMRIFQPANGSLVEARATGIV
jgi:hypothetical protein